MGSAVSHCRSNSAHGRVKRAGNVYGRSWLPGTASTGVPNERRNTARPLVLLAAPAIREVAGGDDDVRRDPVDQRGEGVLDLVILTCTRVKIGYMEDPRRHDRMRL